MATLKLWNFYAPVYNLFMISSKSAYREMYTKISKTIQNKKVLELACGTGLIANHVADSSKTYIATDFAENMLIQAQKKKSAEQLRFMKADASDLPFENHSFDVVILSNALHVIPHPEKVLAETARVLKTGGILIAPNFLNQNISPVKQMMFNILKSIGIDTAPEWNEEEYLQFLKQNHFHIKKKVILKAMFPLIYIEAGYR